MSIASCFHDKFERFGHPQRIINIIVKRTERRMQMNVGKQTGSERSTLWWNLSNFFLKPSTPIFYLVHFFYLLSGTFFSTVLRKLIFNVCCLRENLCFSLFVLYEEIFSWMFSDHILNPIWLTWIAVLLLTGVRKVTWC